MGVNRFFSRTLQEENHEKRWGLMVELAKVHNVPYVAKMTLWTTKAASIIQRAVRKKAAIKDCCKKGTSHYQTVAICAERS